MHTESAIPTFFYYLHTKKNYQLFFIRYSVHNMIPACMQLRTMEKNFK